MRASDATRFFTVLCLLTGTIAAQCRTSIPVPGPGTPGTATPRSAPSAVLTAPRRAQVLSNTWDVWWQLHRLEFLRRVPASSPQSGDPADALRERERLRETRVRPALRTALAERNETLVPQLLIALGRLGGGADPMALREEVQAHLRSSDAATREVTALALGLGGWPGSSDALGHLFLDDRDGRRMCAKARVPARVRAFAGYGAGLLAQDDADLATKRALFEALATGLAPDADRNAAAAAATALGMLRLDPDHNIAEKRLLWQVAAALQRFAEAPRGAGDQIVQSHALLAMARLTRRSNSAEQRALEATCLRVLDPRSGRRYQQAFVQAAALALGRLAEPRESDPSDARYSDALLRGFRRDRDPQTRSFCLIALGRIGGAHNRTELLKILHRGSKGVVKPWAALALGILAFPKPDGAVDATVGDALLRELETLRNPEALGAVAVAVGLSGHAPAAPVLRQLLDDNDSREELAPHIATALGLLRDRAAVPGLREVARQSARRPAILVGCALALREIGDDEVTPLLVEMLADAKSNVVLLTAVAVALEQTGDERALEPLLRLLADRHRASLARAYAAMALGGIFARRAKPWYAEIGEWVNYAARVETLIQ